MCLRALAAFHALSSRANVSANTVAVAVRWAANGSGRIIKCPDNCICSQISNSTARARVRDLWRAVKMQLERVWWCTFAAHTDDVSVYIFFCIVYAVVKPKISRRIVRKHDADARFHDYGASVRRPVLVLCAEMLRYNVTGALELGATGNSAGFAMCICWMDGMVIRDCWRMDGLIDIWDLTASAAST